MVEKENQLGAFFSLVQDYVTQRTLPMYILYCFVFVCVGGQLEHVSGVRSEIRFRVEYITTVEIIPQNQ